MGQIVQCGGGTPNHLKSNGDRDTKKRSAPTGRRALVLGGGGIAGAAFEVGALLALNDALVDFKVTDFDLYVGTSAGAFLSACLVNGITPEAFARSQLGDGPADIPGIARREVLKPTHRKIGKSSLVWASALRRAALQMARSGFANSSLIDAFFTTTQGLTSWKLYTTQGMEQYLRKILSRRGRTNRFERLERELYITATDLDTAERVVFGQESAPPATISQAVSASAAIPIIYEPVKLGGREYLDGGLRSATNVDVAVEHGAEFIVLINPLVPYLHDARYLLREHDLAVEHLSDGGLGRLIAQVFRTMAQAQLDKELELIRLRHPNVDVLVIEPRRDDENLFIFNLMDYSARMRVARDAFEQVAVNLVTHFPSIRRLLRGAGIGMSKDVLLDQLQNVLAGGTAEAFLASAAEESA
jgi:NTE family protein